MSKITLQDEKSREYLINQRLSNLSFIGIVWFVSLWFVLVISDLRGLLSHEANCCSPVASLMTRASKLVTSSMKVNIFELATITLKLVFIDCFWSVNLLLVIPCKSNVFIANPNYQTIPSLSQAIHRYEMPRCVEYFKHTHLSPNARLIPSLPLVCVIATPTLFCPWNECNFPARPQMRSTYLSPPLSSPRPSPPC